MWPYLMTENCYCRRFQNSIFAYFLSSVKHTLKVHVMQVFETVVGYTIIYETLRTLRTYITNL